MKTITIPERFGYPTVGIIANGEHYTLNSGAEITVEDHIAEIIENAIALAPKQGRNLSRFAQRVEGSISDIDKSELEGIEVIATYAFAFCKGITKTTIPNSVKNIEAHAFYGCTTLKSVTMGDSITNIGVYAFDWCTTLERVYLPEIPPILANVNAFGNVKANCTFYCKTQASLDAYKKAANWSTLTGTYSFVVEEK